MEAKNKRTPIFKRWWFWAIVIVLIIGVANQGGDGQSSNKSQQADKNQQESIADKEESNKADENKVYGIDELVETKTLNIIINKMEKPEGGEFNKPAEGKEFVTFDLSIENTSDKDITISSVLLFNAYVDDVTVNDSFSALLTGNKKTVDGTVAPGKKLNGTLGYEVPKDWKEIEIHFEPSALKSEKIIFKIANE